MFRLVVEKTGRFRYNEARVVIPMYFKENLRYLRKKYHITQNDLAEKFGYKSFTTIQKWEDGTSMPKMSILQQLADFFNLTIERLINQDLTRDEMSGVRVPGAGQRQGGL